MAWHFVHYSTVLCRIKYHTENWHRKIRYSNHLDPLKEKPWVLTTLERSLLKTLTIIFSFPLLYFCPSHLQWKSRHYVTSVFVYVCVCLSKFVRTITDTCTFMDRFQVKAYSKNSCASGHPTLPRKLPPTLTFFSDATKKIRGVLLQSVLFEMVRRITEIPLFLGYLIQISDKCTIHLSFFVLLTQYAFKLTFIVSLKHHDKNKHADNVCR